jgi:uncharacterized repeat protein (TIGR03803 family)
MKKLRLERIACILITFCALSGVAAFSQTFTTIASFDGTDGAAPFYTPLVQGANGNFYGTTEAGGASNGGTVFEVTSAGAVTTLYNFCAKVNCRDGGSPFGGLTQTANGDIYGTTHSGGSGRNCADYCGTIFEISPEGKLTTIHSFCAQTNCADGAEPYDTLVQAYDGDFYGTTYTGGANANCSGCGTVFKITPTGTFATLYSFCSLTNCADGGEPAAGLALATDGKLYGSAPDGGANGNGGTIFSITPAGKLTTLYSFCSLPSCADGNYTQPTLIQASDGNFYGTTVFGGANDSACNIGCGTIFKITPAGKLTTLYSFCSQPGCADGQYPEAGLIQATDGNFYGTTSGGANSNAVCDSGPGCGTVFKITPTGTFTTLYSFCPLANCADGANPYAAPVQGTDGNLYGTTGGGGTGSCPTYGCGTVFSLSMGLAPFVETLPVARAVGLPVTILGNNLTGTTSVTFNGTAATLITVSDTAITTTVPAGATTGPVQVVTPNGTLTSNVPFRVIP